jgi:hypothetical protein
MKREAVMLGLAMMTGLPHVANANGAGEDSASSAFSTTSSSYLLRYGGGASPMDHLSVSEILPQRFVGNEWQMKFMAPPAAYQSQSDNPLMANDKRVGVTFKLDF